MSAARCNQLTQRHVNEIGIAVVGGAIGKGELQRLGERMQVVGESCPSAARSSSRKTPSAVTSTPPPELGGGMP